jgi:cytochrome c553
VRLVVLLLLVSGGSVSSQAAPAAVPADHAARMKAGTALFTESIRPVLMEQCLACHGGEKTRAGFSLASRDALLDGGDSGPALDLESPGDSHLLALLRHDEEPFMPAKKPRLPDPTLDAFRRWIELGAPYDRPLTEESARPAELTVSDSDRAFWSFRPLAPAEPPSGASPWARNDLDRFLAAAQTDAGVTPNPEADRRTLARRAALSLTGLPPDADAVDALVADSRPDAWSRFVEALLASPAFGEHQARQWMDVARFAESSGFEHDYDRPSAYHYRDFLIQAFEADVPWDRFTAWQLAGDELAPDQPLALQATGFLAAGVFPTQLTEAEFETARYDELDDMVGTTGVAFLGLSVACARCHDHKYDPIPSRDYYALAATFATAIRSETELEFHPETYPAKLAPWEARERELVSALAAHEATLAPAFAAWLQAPDRPALAAPSPWHVLAPVSLTARDGTTFTPQPDGSHLASPSAPAREEYTAALDVPAGTAALRLEALAHPTLPRQGPGRAANGNFALGDLVVTARPAADPQAPPRRLRLVAARATHQQNTGGLSAASAIDADPNATGWAVDGGGIGRDQAAVFAWDAPLPEDSRLVVTMRFHVNGQHSPGRIRFSSARDASAPPSSGDGVPEALASALLRLGRDGPDRLAAADLEVLRRAWTGADAGWQERNAALETHRAARPGRDLRPVMICSEGVKPLKHHADGRGYPHFYPEVHLLERGNPKQKKEVASPGFLQVLLREGASPSDWRTPPPDGARTSHRRAALARWLTDPDRGAGHLLARVAVNRVWQQHFGRGLVATPNDFGFQGARPSHPELLDWLAADFIAHGWTTKRLHRMILESAAWRQSSDHDPADAARDVDNTLLWRYPARRLSAEAIRDSLLAVSGLLDPARFGPGSLDEAMRRRSVYFTVKRSRLPNVMLVFDWPEHLVSIGQRPSTTVAPQALYFMNSPQARRYAAGLAARSGGSLDAVYRLALLRSPTPEERAAARSFLDSQARHHPAPDAARLALTDFCQALLASNEFLHLP